MCLVLCCSCSSFRSTYLFSVVLVNHCKTIKDAKSSMLFEVPPFLKHHKIGDPEKTIMVALDLLKAQCVFCFWALLEGAWAFVLREVLKVASLILKGVPPIVTHKYESTQFAIQSSTETSPPNHGLSMFQYLPKQITVQHHEFLPWNLTHFRDLSAPSVAIFLRLRLRFFDVGEKSQRFLGPWMVLPPYRALRLRRKIASDCDCFAIFQRKKRPRCGLADNGDVCDRKSRRFAIAIFSALSSWPVTRNDFYRQQTVKEWHPVRHPWCAALQ